MQDEVKPAWSRSDRQRSSGRRTHDQTAAPPDLLPQRREAKNWSAPRGGFGTARHHIHGAHASNHARAFRHRSAFRILSRLGMTLRVPALACELLVGKGRFDPLATVFAAIGIVLAHFALARDVRALSGFGGSHGCSRQAAVSRQGERNAGEAEVTKQRQPGSACDKACMIRQCRIECRKQCRQTVGFAQKTRADLCGRGSSQWIGGTHDDGRVESALAQFGGHPGARMKSGGASSSARRRSRSRLIASIRNRHAAV